MTPFLVMWWWWHIISFFENCLCWANDFRELSTFLPVLCEEGLEYFHPDVLKYLKLYYPLFACPLCFMSSFGIPYLGIAFGYPYKDLALPINFCSLPSSSHKGIGWSELLPARIREENDCSLWHSKFPADSYLLC